MYQDDQQLHNLHIPRKIYQWYRKFALRLISQAISNVHKICVRTRGVNDVTFLKFMHDTITLTLQVTLS